MTRSAHELDAFGQRWRRSFIWGLVGWTAFLLAGWAILDGQTIPSVSNWAKIGATYAIFLVYGAIQWRAARRKFLTGASADEAMRTRH